MTTQTECPLPESATMKGKCAECFFAFTCFNSTVDGMELVDTAEEDDS